MFKTIVFTATLAFTSVLLAGCSDEQDNQVGQDVNPEWSENPYEENEGRSVQNPEPTDEINRNREGDQLNENNADSDETGLEEATEQGIGQQY